MFNQNFYNCLNLTPQINKSMSQLVIGIDIGATKIAAGVLDEEANILSNVVVPTLAQEEQSVVLGQVYKAIDDLQIDLKNVGGIGVCAPGPLQNGVIINPPNIPHWRNLPLAKLIADRYKLPVALENDASAAGYAEMIFGSAQGYKNFVYVTVSTGIGTGIIIDQKIYRGKNGLAAEGGHVTVDYKNKVDCSCGVPGCIESIASGTGIAKAAQAKLHSNPKVQTLLWEYCASDLSKITTHEINKAIKANDSFAKELIEEAGYKIGIWLGGVISLLDPEVIVIGGGVTQGQIGELLLAKIKSTAPKSTINAFADKTPILPAKLQKDVGIYGAASLMFKTR
jgi:glucokinase